MGQENTYKNIPVKPETKERVDHLARKNEKYDDFIKKLLDVFEEKRRKKGQIT